MCALSVADFVVHPVTGAVRAATKEEAVASAAGAAYGLFGSAGATASSCIGIGSSKKLATMIYQLKNRSDELTQSRAKDMDLAYECAKESMTDAYQLIVQSRGGDDAVDDEMIYKMHEKAVTILIARGLRKPPALATVEVSVSSEGEEATLIVPRQPADAPPEYVSA